MSDEPGGAYRCPSCGRKIGNGYPGSRCYHGIGNPKLWARMRPDYLRPVLPTLGGDPPSPPMETSGTAPLSASEPG